MRRLRCLLGHLGQPGPGCGQRPAHRGRRRGYPRRGHGADRGRTPYRRKGYQHRDLGPMLRYGQAMRRKREGHGRGHAGRAADTRQHRGGPHDDRGEVAWLRLQGGLKASAGRHRLRLAGHEKGPRPHGHAGAGYRADHRDGGRRLPVVVFTTGRGPAGLAHCADNQDCHDVGTLSKDARQHGPRRRNDHHRRRVGCPGGEANLRRTSAGRLRQALQGRDFGIQ